MENISIHSAKDYSNKRWHCKIVLATRLTSFSKKLKRCCWPVNLYIEVHTVQAFRVHVGSSRHIKAQNCLLRFCPHTVWQRFQVFDYDVQASLPVVIVYVWMYLNKWVTRIRCSKWTCNIDKSVVAYLNINVSKFSRCCPFERRLKTAERIKLSIGNADLKKWGNETNQRHE